MDVYMCIYIYIYMIIIITMISIMMIIIIIMGRPTSASARRRCPLGRAVRYDRGCMLSGNVCMPEFKAPGSGRKFKT